MKIISYVIELNSKFLRYDNQHSRIEWVIDPHQATKFKSTTIQNHFEKLKQKNLILYPDNFYHFIAYATACIQFKQSL